MSKPTVQRDGDEWVLTWPEYAIGMGMARFREHSDGLHAEIEIEATQGENSRRLHGPVKINILSTESQTRLANVLEKATKGTPWEATPCLNIVRQACAIVAKEYREGEPVIDLAEMADPGPVAYLYPQWVPLMETTVLWADGESGKSMLALAVALSTTGGWYMPSIGFPTMQMNVLYLDWETTARTVRSRLSRLCDGLGVERIPRIHYRSMRRPLVDEIAALRSEISRLKIGLVVVDSIGFAATGPLVDDETARSTMNALRHLDPATRLVVAHVSKESAMAEKGGSRPFGSAFFWNAMRSGIEVRKAQDETTGKMLVGLYHRKANDGEHAKPTAISFTFDGPTGPVRMERADLWQDDGLAARTPISMRIRAILKKEALLVGDLADVLDEKPNAVLSALKRMQDVVELNPGSRGRGNAGKWGLVNVS